MHDHADIHDRLLTFLAAQLDGISVQVTNLSKIGVGRSRDNWVFDLITDHDGIESREPLILRSDPEGGLVETDRRAEFALLDALEKSDLPTPIARWLDAEGRWFGRPSLVMRRAPGLCDYKILNNEVRSASERRMLAEQFCGLLAQVHLTDWRSLGITQVLPEPSEAAALAELVRWEQILRRDALEPYPELELALTVLREAAPTAARIVLVHADFKPGNILLQDNQVTALLDWELAHLGDPLEDLGWVTQPLRASEHLIPAVWETPDLLKHYEDATGCLIDRRSLSWWQTFSTFKTAVMQVSGLRSFLDGRSDEPYRPTRRVLDTLLEAIAKEDHDAADR